MNIDLPGSLTLLFFVLDLFSSMLNAILVYARPSRLEEGDTDENLTAVTTMLESPAAYLSLRIGQGLFRVLLVMMAVVWFLTARHLTFLRLGDWLGLLLGAFLLVLSEFLIAGMVASDADHLVVSLRWAFKLWMLLFAPLTWVLLQLLPEESLEAFQPAMTEDDLKDWVASENEDSGLQEEERRMIYSILQFGETLAREIMVPRIDVTALDIDTPLDDATRTVISSGHSRVPVYEDTIDNIIGLLYAKDLLLLHTEREKNVTLRDLLRPAYFIPETKKAEDLLAEMQTQRIHMAIVVDEYGGFAGLVTLEDIVEEIVGEIMDEYDQTEEQPFVKISPDEYLFAGRINIDDFNEIMQAHLMDDEADTLAGFLYDQLGHVPDEGESLDVNGLRLTVEQVNGRRIRRVRVQRIAVPTKKG